MRLIRLDRSVCVPCLGAIVLFAAGCADSANPDAPTERTVQRAATPQSSAWQVYANRGGDSGIAAYATGDDFIRVRFRDGSVYTYTHASAGKAKIDRMKQLAEEGEGLNTYISQHAKFDYAETD